MDKTVELLTPAQMHSLETLSDDVWNWFQTVQLKPGWIRFATDGTLFEPGEHAGLGISALALKALYTLNLVPRLSDDVKQAWGERIQSFQHRRGFRAGYFEDSAVRRAVGQRVYLPWNIPPAWQATMRAETRQACAALNCLGKTAAEPLHFVPRTEEGIRRYVVDRDWKFPWAAGSHTSHMMAFLRINKMAGRDDEARLLPVILQELDKLQDSETGCWRTGNPDTAQLINGAMKVLTGYAYVGLPFNHAEQLIDFALNLRNDHDACHHVDLVYVLYRCALQTDYRRDEICQVAAQRLDEIMAFRKPDGGFSFFEHGSGSSYYGAKMSKNLPLSDVHGTSLFSWAVTMIADLLGVRESLGWNFPPT